MGGARETVIDNVRIHENAGEVHLHDDKAGLKCAVNSAEFWSMWDNINKKANKGHGYTATFTDKLGSSCEAQIKLLAPIGKPPSQTDITIQLSAPLNFGDNYNKLKDFVTNR